MCLRFTYIAQTITSLVVLIWDFIVGMIVRILVVIIRIIAVIIILLLRSMLSVPCVVLGLNLLVLRCVILIGLIRVDVILRDGYVSIVLCETVTSYVST